MYDAILADGASADLVVRRMQGLARRFGWYVARGALCARTPARRKARLPQIVGTRAEEFLR